LLRFRIVNLLITFPLKSQIHEIKNLSSPTDPYDVTNRNETPKIDLKLKKREGVTALHNKEYEEHQLRAITVHC